MHSDSARSDLPARESRADAIAAELNLFRSGPVVVVRWRNEPNWPAEYVSPNIAELAGVSAESLVSGRVIYMDLIHPDDRARITAEVDHNILEKIDAYDQEYRLLRPDGSSRWIHDATRAVRNNGSVTHLNGYLLDITERKVAEESLRENERSLREAQRIAAMGSWAVDLATDHISYSEEMYRILGISPDTFSHDPQGFLALIHPDDRAGMADWIQAVNSGLRPDEEQVFRIVHPDGAIRFIRGRGRAFFDAQGRVVRVAGTAQDITERKRANDLLRESEERYRTLAEAAHDMIFIIDRNDRVVYVNRYAAQSLHRPPEDIIGQPRSTFFPGEAGEQQKRSLDRVFGNGEPYYAESSYAVPNRTVRLGTWLVPIRDAQQQITSVLGVSRDITEQKTLEERLRQAHKMEAVGQLAGGVAHDFSNQLVGILGFADLLSRRLTDEKLKTYAEYILASARRSADLTRQLLAFARKGKQQTIRVDLHAIVREVVSLLKRSIDKRIILAQRLEAPSCNVLGDPAQIHNTVLNLALNARDAMPSGGELSFETRWVELDGQAGQIVRSGSSPGSHIELSVRDTGIGMSEEILSHIFEPFFTTKEPGKGTGMGLASVYGTVQNHHGAISVDSEPGKGSVFRICLPLAHTAEEAQLAQPEPGPRVPHAHILVVDDEEVVRTFVAELLRSAGHSTALCRDGHEGLEYYRRHAGQVDLVILDMIMPGMGGADLYRAMRQINPHVRVILASGYSLERESQALLQEGVLAFVQKPFMEEEFARIVAKALTKGTERKSVGG